MNHDATHCLDYKKSCPKSCYRAQLTEELNNMSYPLKPKYTSWSHYEGSKECSKTEREEQMKFTNYTFKFKGGEITVRALNENQARILAQAQAINRCWDYEIIGVAK